MIRVLLELRPALSGYAGIPQETRLLFRELCSLSGLETEGLIQSSTRYLSPGIKGKAAAASSDIDALSAVIVSLLSAPTFGGSRALKAADGFGKLVDLLVASLAGRTYRLTHFDATHFSDFIWATFFAKTLPHTDFSLVTSAHYRIATTPWQAFHRLGTLASRFGYSRYPKIDTSEFDVFISETPYPGSVSKRTTLIVRYHDSIPILLPHTISDRVRHRTEYINSLKRNVADGAWFACVSDATRADLVSIFPEVEERAVTIHNSVSDDFFVDERSPTLISQIVRSRLMASEARQGSESEGLISPTRYLLMVSTIEPRKNHLTLLDAWDRLRSESFPDLTVVFVGSLGWEHKEIFRRMQRRVGDGVFLLEGVEASELRLLYRHATLVVCPSVAEGFDYSGVEAMRSGAALVASDIKVHREIFADSAAYFSPYSVSSLVEVITNLIGTGTSESREALRLRGIERAREFTLERAVPKWHALLERTLSSRLRS
jgi:glycosyltransferase involved in cell wall biosynthesis